MSEHDEVIRAETFKDQGLDVHTRILFTLTVKGNLQGKRTAKAVALLLELLHKTLR